MLKIFTIFENNSIALLILLNECFERVTIFKPCTSKAGNSELYIICENYINTIALHENYTQFLDMYRNGSSEKFYEYITTSNINYEQIYECAKLFTNYQIETISNNLFTFGFNFLNDSELNQLKSNIVKFYTKLCKPKKLNPQFALMNTYEDTLFINRGYLKNVNNFFQKENGDYTFFNSKIDLDTILVHITVGKSFRKILSSKFCDYHNITDFEKNFLKIENCDSNTINFEQIFEPNNYDTSDKLVCKNLLNLVCKFSEHENLFIINYFPLTIFSLNFLFILKQCFEYVSCNYEKRLLVFENFIKNDNAIDILRTVLNEQNNLIKLNDDKTITRFLNPKIIFLDIFYEFIKFFNNNSFNCTND